MAGFIANRRLYLNAANEVVEHDDPSKVTLLVGEGGTVPEDRARELGLYDLPDDVKAKPKAANKARTRAANKRAPTNPATEDDTGGDGDGNKDGDDAE